MLTSACMGSSEVIGWREDNGRRILRIMWHKPDNRQVATTGSIDFLKL